MFFFLFKHAKFDCSPGGLLSILVCCQLAGPTETGRGKRSRILGPSNRPHWDNVAALNINRLSSFYGIVSNTYWIQWSSSSENNFSYRRKSTLHVNLAMLIITRPHLRSASEAVKVLIQIMKIHTEKGNECQKRQNTRALKLLLLFVVILPDHVIAPMRGLWRLAILFVRRKSEGHEISPNWFGANTKTKNTQ